MYTPKHFKMNDRKEIFDFIHKNSFAILVSQNNGKLVATHIPVLLKESEGVNGVLYGHIAKANEQLKNINEEVLVIFPGAHKYISSSWYESTQTVPTWSYLSVHVYGNIKIIADRENKEFIVRDVVKYFEGEKSNYSIDNLKPGYFGGLLKSITAFKVEITRIEGKKKISQNHPKQRQQRVISELEKSDDENSKQIAGLMKENIEKKHDTTK